MDGGRPIRRDKLRLAQQAVSLWQSGASVGVVAQRLKSRKQRAMRLSPRLEERMHRMSEQQRLDLADPRNTPAELRGKPVVLAPLDGQDGDIIMIGDAAGRPIWVGDLSEVRDELSFSGDLADMNGSRADLSGDEDDGLSDAEVFAPWQRFRNGDDAPETSTGDPDEDEPAASLSQASPGDPDEAGDGLSRLSDDQLYEVWRADAASQGYDLSDETGPTLSPGDAVEWGSGFGKGHGIVMEVDTSTGNVNVHACEVVTEGGAGPQLSPTGKTIKIDGAKLRKTSLVLVGEEPVGPELSADLSDDDPGVGTDADDDATFWTKVQRSLKRMGGGFGA